jgi:hypothetical protein
MAIFVEGQTEQIFAEELLFAIAGRRLLHVDVKKIEGGGCSGPRALTEVSVYPPGQEVNHYVIIYNSTNDDRVLTDIRDRYQELVDQGFQRIIAMRDVRPRLSDDIPTIRSDFQLLTPSNPFSPILILAVMEIEAWFIAEWSHFEKLNAALTLPRVIAQLGFDPQTHAMESIPTPFEHLRSVYNLVGLGYKKSRDHVERTVSILDYAIIYLTLSGRFGDIGTLVG